MTDVILLERIESLGQMGDIVKVRPGYARNFLLPQHKALRATEANKKVFESRRVQLEALNLKKKQEAEAVAAKMDKLTVTLIRSAGESGMLYGSVSARDIAEAIGEAGFTIGRSQIPLNEAFKNLGLFQQRVILHPEVSLNITINVARSQEEAAIQKQKGEALLIKDEPADETMASESEAA